MKRWFALLLTLTIVFALAAPSVVLAQDEAPGKDITFFTTYPSQVVGIGETVTLPLRLRTTAPAQVISLSMKEVPEGWTATFRGSGRAVEAVYAEAGVDATVDLRLEQPANVAAGTYKFVAVAKGEHGSAELTIYLTIQEKTSPKLTLKTELPTLKGTPGSTFRYSADLKNEGGDDLTVNLVAEAPAGFQVNFKVSGQDVTSFPLAANESKSLSIEAQTVSVLEGGTYRIVVRAQGGVVDATLELTAEVTGQATLLVTAPEGRLSGQAYAGRETPLKVIVANNGTAPANAIELSSSTPSGWTIEFDPKKIDTLDAGQQVEVTAKVRPPEKAVAGDYVLTVRARPANGTTQSADFRITVLTSTLWGVVGIVLVAIAVAVVAMAVMRFGRR